jgi:hypothetical protein
MGGQGNAETIANGTRKPYWAKPLKACRPSCSTGEMASGAVAAVLVSEQQGSTRVLNGAGVPQVR